MNGATGWVRCYGITAIAAMCLLGLAAGAFGAAPQEKPKRPELKQIRMYEFALSTSATTIDFQKRTMDAFVRGVRLSDKEEKALRKKANKDYQIYRIKCPMPQEELDVLKAIVDDGQLRGFGPVGSDVKHRFAGLDECPPQLVLIWSDKTEVFRLPLSDTVKPDLPQYVKLRYKAMDDLCERIYKLREEFGKPPFVSLVPVHGPEYQAMWKERDKILGH